MIQAARGPAKSSAASAPQTRWHRAAAVLRRAPFTAALVVALLVVAIATGTLWSPTVDKPWFGEVSVGIPSLAEGKWWTVFTSPFFVAKPLVFLTLSPLLIGGVGWAEWKFGSLKAAALFFAGHIVGVLGASALIAGMAQLGSDWALRLSEHTDVGPSCGAFTALVFAIATLASPWRLRARIAVVLWITISALYLGTLYDVEHAVSLLFALIVSGLLPQFRHRAGRPSAREWRLIAFSGLIAIGVIQVLGLVVPYAGPLGNNIPTASIIDAALDVIVIALIANGIRQGYRLAWVIALIAGAFNVVSSLALIALTPLLIEFGAIDSRVDILGLAVAPAALWAALLAVLITGSGAFKARLRSKRRDLAAEHIEVAELIERLQRFGGGTISWMSTWSLNRLIAAGAQPRSGHEQGAPTGAIAYQAHAGVAIVLGDPIVAGGETTAALEGFAAAAQQAGLIPCAFSVSEAAATARPAGWRSVVVAEDTIVDLPGLEFKGKAWGDARTAINRAGRENIEFRMVRLADAPWSTLAQVRAISEQWSGDKGLPEMRFTLGTVEEALDPNVLVSIAVDEEGSLHGIASWLPVFGPAARSAAGTGEATIVGWTLDLMRRRDGGFGPVMEFLIASSAKHFSEQGYQFVSLSGAPLVRPDDLEPGPVDHVLAQIGALIEPLYGFKSLHRFKQKFNPRHEPLHLLYRDEGDLPRIGIALTKAYLPDASLRDLIASATPAKV